MEAELAEDPYKMRNLTGGVGFSNRDEASQVLHEIVFPGVNVPSPTCTPSFSEMFMTYLANLYRFFLLLFYCSCKLDNMTML